MKCTFGGKAGPAKSIIVYGLGGDISTPILVHGLGVDLSTPILVYGCRQVFAMISGFKKLYVLII